MGTPRRPCPGCGAPVSEEIKFCGQCGQDLRASREEASPAGHAAGTPAASRRSKQTVLGMATVHVQGSPAPAAGSAPASPAPSAPAAATPPAALQQTPGSDPPAPTPAERPAARPNKNRTIIGMTAPTVAPANTGGADVSGAGTPASAAAPAPADPSAAPSESTGQGGPGASPPSARAEPGGGVAEPASARSARTSAPPTTDRTMLGMPAVTPPPAEHAETGASGSRAQPERQIPAASNRTMLGMSAHRTSSPPAAPAHPARERSPVQFGEPVGFEDSGSYTPPRSGPSIRIIVGTLATLVLLAAVGGVIAYLVFGRDDEPLVRATVVQGDGGEQLRVEVPGADEGSKLRFRGTELPLAEGSAVFPLAAEALQIGENRLVVDVVGPDGDVEQAEVTLVVRYRVRSDLSGLQGEPPTLGVVVDALNGSLVTLDGEPVALDGQGRGRKQYPLPASEAAGDAHTHEARYRVRLPDGSTEEGVVRTRVPYAQMQLDRPGTDVVTDQDAIEIAGAVHPDASVTIDGEAVEVDDGRFVHAYPVPEARVYGPRIVTRQTGRVPRVTAIRIRKVEDMAAEAAGFEPDPAMSYAAIQQDPDPHRGKKIAIEGRVYNVNVEGGRSDIQILARECPNGQRCPVWVSYPAATTLGADDNVRVLGTVAGQQQFRSETNRVITVPRIDAQFVLPLRR